MYTKIVDVSFQKEACMYPTKGARMLYRESPLTSVWHVLHTYSVNVCCWNPRLTQYLTRLDFLNYALKLILNRLSKEY